MHSIMLVDNEAAIIKGLTNGMDWGKCGCRIAATAANGLKAVAQLQTGPVDIIISDIRMPGMDGLELAQWVQANMPRTKVILLTGFPDFDYAKQAINYRVVDFVLKPSTEENLARALEKAKRILLEEEDQQLTVQKLKDQTRQSILLQQNLLLYDLLYHANISAVYTCNRVAELRLPLLSYYVIRFGVASKAEGCDYSLFVQQAQAIFSDVFSTLEIHFVPKSDRFCYTVLCAPPDTPVKSRCQQAVAIANEQSEFMLSVGISRHHKDPLTMRAAAFESTHAQQFAEYSLQLPVICYEQMPELAHQDWKRVTDELKALESAMEQQSRQKAEDAYERLFRFIRGQKLPVVSVQQICSIIYNFSLTMLLNFDMVEQMPGNSILSIEQLFENASLEAIEAQLHSFVTGVLDCVICNHTNIDDIVFFIKRHVDQYFAKELSLESLARQVHLSPSYLSKLFKREIGQNLSVYILNVRIEKAKLLLRSTNMKTYEIAEAVGINDPVYFSKLFKKTALCKPKEYRMNAAGVEDKT